MDDQITMIKGKIKNEYMETPVPTPEAQKILAADDCDKVRQKLARNIQSWLTVI